MTDYQGNVSLHEASHAAVCILYEIPFLRIVTVPGRFDGTLDKYAGCLVYGDHQHPRWHIDIRNFITYPACQEATPPVGARTVLEPLSPDEIIDSIRHCIVSFSGAVVEELDPYNRTGKHTGWGPQGDFDNIRLRIAHMSYLNNINPQKKIKAVDEEVLFEKIFETTRRLFSDSEGGDKTILWQGTVEIGKVLWHKKKLSEGNCRLLYNKVQPPVDRRRKAAPPEEWPKLRFNLEEEEKRE